MQKRYLTTLFAPILVVSACASISASTEEAATGNASMPKNCPPAPSTILTAANGKSTAAPSSINITKDTVDVEDGCPFVIKNPQNHEISTTSGEGWLWHIPTNDDITLTPPLGTPEGVEYKYTIIVTDLGELDPRARVI